jgi:hypothetical protein
MRCRVGVERDNSRCTVAFTAFRKKRIPGPLAHDKLLGERQSWNELHRSAMRAYDARNVEREFHFRERLL